MSALPFDAKLEQILARREELSPLLAEAQPGDWEGVIANAESIGFRLEEESDRARRDETTERNRQLRR